MAGRAGGADAGGLLGRRELPVRIVAGEAGEGAAARAEAAALAEPVGVMVDLEALARRPPLLVDVDLDEVIGERLAGAEGEVAAAEPPQAGDRDGRLEVAGHAHLVALLRRQPAGVPDARADLLGDAHAAHRVPDVLGGRAVAALAADPLRQAARERLDRAVGIGARRQVGIVGVAEDALAPHAAGDALVVRAVEAGGHAPAPRLGVPGEGELVDLAAGRLVEVGPRAAAGAEDPVDGDLESVDGPARAVGLPALEEQSIAPAGEAHRLPGGLMDERRRRQVLALAARPRPAERPRHPALGVGRREIAVAERARPLVRIPRRRPAPDGNAHRLQILRHEVGREGAGGLNGCGVGRGAERGVRGGAGRRRREEHREQPQSARRREARSHDAGEHSKRQAPAGWAGTEPRVLGSAR